MTKPLNILFLSHRIPYPPNKGEKIRAFNEILHLSKHHTIHLLSFYDHPEEVEYAAELKRSCETVTLIPLNRPLQCLRAGWELLRGRPWSPGFFFHPRMTVALRELSDRFPMDRILVYCSSVAGYADAVSGIPKALDFVDSDALKWKQYSGKRRPPLRWLYAYEAKKLLQFERRMIRSFDHSVFVSAAETEGQPLEGLKEKVSYIQNGIDLDFFKPSPIPPSTPGIAFTGAMDYYPNIDGVLFFANEIFPLIRRARPDAHFYVIGSRPVRAIRKLSALPGITVTGTVPDIRPYLSRCQVAAVPLRIAQGIQNKILEALASGLPVVATPLAAGRLAETGQLPLSVAADADAFSRTVLDYLQSAPLPAAAIAATRQYLKLNYDWETNLSRLSNILISLSPLSGSVSDSSLHSGSAIRNSGSPDKEI